MRSFHILAMVLAIGAIGMAALPEAAAQSERTIRTQAEASMVLSGTVDVGPEGQVEGFALDQRDDVPVPIAGFVDEVVNAWRFAPGTEDGRPVRMRTPVTLRIGGKSQPDGATLLTLLAANFDHYDPAATDTVTSLTMRPPSYPDSVASIGGRGDVLLLLKIGRDGHVLDVATEQVNMKVVARGAEMQRMRDVLARASMAAARSWSFRAPTTGRDKDANDWTVRVPVSFAFHGEDVRYGAWDVYVPGPRQQAPWRADRALADDAGGLLPAGGVYMADATPPGPQLLTPPGT